MLEQFDATHQPYNNGKDDNMNSTTDIPEIAHTFDPSTFTVVPARRLKTYAHRCARLGLPGRFG